MMSHISSRHHHQIAVWLLLNACQITLTLAAPVALTSTTTATSSYDSTSSTTPPSTTVPTIPDDTSADAQAAGSLFSILSTSKCEITSTPLSSAITRREWDPIDKPYILALFMLGVILVGIIVACRTCKGCTPQVHPGDAYLRYTARPDVAGQAAAAPGPARGTGRHHAVAPAAVVGTGPGMSAVSVFASRGGERAGQGEPRTAGRLLGHL